MKWTFVIQQKIKAALALGSIMLMIVFFTFLEKKNIADMNRSVSSIYNDRLIPATDIFYLSEHLYGKLFLAEQFLQSEDSNINTVQTGLRKHNKAINLLIARFEKTYLLEEESKYLSALKSIVHSYQKTEEDIIRLSSKGARAAAITLYETEGKEILQAGIKQLVLLTQVQAVAGSELIKNSNGTVASSSMISSIQIVLSIVTGLIIISLIFAAGVTAGKEKNFHLN